MKIHRFYFEEVQTKDLEVADKNFTHQVFRVLKLKAGERVILFNGVELNDFVFVIDSIDSKIIKLKFIELNVNASEPKKFIHLYLSILKSTNFELAVAKSVELGVGAVTPIISERTVKTNLNLARIEKIIKEAAEQAGRGIVPRIFAPIKFTSALDQAKNPIIFDPLGTDKTADNIKEVSIFIGPEGGWTPNELELARSKKAIIAKLGSTILRAETATIVATFKQTS